MNPKIVLVVAATVFALGFCALGGALVAVKSGQAPAPVAPAPAAPAPAPAAPVAPAPAAPAPAPAARAPAPAAPAPAPVAPAVPVPIVASPVAPPLAPAAPAPVAAAPAPSPSPATPSRPMRPELGFSVVDVPLLQDLVNFGSHSVSVADKAPKISAIAGGTPAANAGLVVDDRVFAVDGRSIGSAAEFENALRDKTAPGEVSIRTGRTSSEARDVKLVVK